MKIPIKRGDIYYANLNPIVDSEQGGHRPVLIVSNDIGNKHGPTIIITPITCTLKKKSLPTHVEIPRIIGLEVDSMVLTEQIRTLDRTRLGEYIGRIGNKIQVEIDCVLMVCVGLEAKREHKHEFMELTLCRQCEDNFINSGYIVVQKRGQKRMEACDFCKMRRGFTFGILSTLN
jgi:mRNA interferase MazF